MRTNHIRDMFLGSMPSLAAPYLASWAKHANAVASRGDLFHENRDQEGLPLVRESGLCVKLRFEFSETFEFHVLTPTRDCGAFSGSSCRVLLSSQPISCRGWDSLIGQLPPNNPTMSSGFVSGGTVDAPIERNDEWLAAQKEIEASRQRKAELARQTDGKSLYETLEANKGTTTKTLLLRMLYHKPWADHVGVLE